MKDFGELSQMSVRDRAAFGIKGGARLGLYLGSVALLAAVVVNRGSSSHVSPLPFALAVLVGITIGGIVFALARPRVRGALSAALVGALSIAPTLVIAPIAVKGFKLAWVALVWSLVMSLLVGGMLGVMAWRGLARTPHSDLAA